jgi:NAD(P)-dependent dehydrogenase (short-subunit alcohol dehydrogenase family)
MSGLAGKVVVVTGCTRGIGRAIAEGCAGAGAIVVLSSRTEAHVARAVHEFAGNDWRASGLATDVSSADDVEQLMHHALDFHGRIDIWVNNAGISAGYRPLDELGVAELDEIVRVNLLGTLYACRLLVPYFREYGGVLLNMAGRGFRGDATPHTAAYAATKAAIASITRSLAEENRDCRRIHIHALVPGMVPTDFYRNVVVSPKLEHSRGNVDLALEAFGVPLDVVGTETAAYLGDGAWHATGQIHNLLKGARTARGAALMAWYGMTGKLKRER